MTTEVKYPLIVSSVYLWMGFVCAISFMEAWLKFRAPGVSLPVGLGIGKLVFAALNKVEWVFAAAIILNLLVAKSLPGISNIGLYIPVLILVLQTVWLLPALDARAELHIKGAAVPSSNIHFYYVAMEVVKVISLFIFSIKLFKS